MPICSRLYFMHSTIVAPFKLPIQLTYRQFSIIVIRRRMKLPYVRVFRVCWYIFPEYSICKNPLHYLLGAGIFFCTFYLIRCVSRPTNLFKGLKNNTGITYMTFEYISTKIFLFHYYVTSGHLLVLFEGWQICFL